MKQDDTYYFYTDQLAVGYDGEPLIENIEIKLKKGQILTIIGPNASGKTTILKTITKFLKSITGTAYINHRAIDEMTNKDMSSELAVVLTDKLKTEQMRCEDVVATGRYPYTGTLGILSENDRLKIKQAMELVNIWALKDLDFSHASDGQKQRVLLARAICQEPQIIVLDEPTSYLDIRYQIELLDILRRLVKQQRLAVIMSLHELDMAQKISDIIMCVKDHHVVKVGPPNEVFTRDRIHALYDLTNGSFNPAFGSVEMGKPSGNPKVFVIAGGGSGISTYRALQKQNMPFVTGVLHRNDIDFQLAEALASQVIAVDSFSEISDSELNHAISHMQSCDVVINCLSDYGQMNQKNKVLAETAVKLGLTLKDSIEQ